MDGITTVMSTAGSTGSAASGHDAARARTDRARELRRNSRASRSTGAAEPEPQDGGTLPAELAQSTTQAEHASQGAQRHADSLIDSMKMVVEAQLLPADGVCEMITNEAGAVTTLISSHFDQTLARITNQTVTPRIGMMMEEIAKNAAFDQAMDPTKVTEDLREMLGQRLKVGEEGKVSLSKAMADWYTAKIQRMANQGVDPTVAMMEGQVEAINESAPRPRIRVCRWCPRCSPWHASSLVS